MRKLCILGPLALAFVVLITTGHVTAPLSTVQAALTGAPASANYQIASDVLAGAGGDSSSTHYRLDDSIGQPEALASSQSANYKVEPAYWHTASGGPTAVALSSFSARSYAIPQRQFRLAALGSEAGALPRIYTHQGDKDEREKTSERPYDK